MGKISIHKRQLRENITAYYFTKSKNRCLQVEYDKRKDYGKNSTSGTNICIEIHYRNSWIKDKLTEIKIGDVPSVIIDVLRYLI